MEKKNSIKHPRTSKKVKLGGDAPAKKMDNMERNSAKNPKIICFNSRVRIILLF